MRAVRPFWSAGKPGLVANIPTDVDAIFERIFCKNLFLFICNVFLYLLWRCEVGWLCSNRCRTLDFRQWTVSTSSTVRDKLQQQQQQYANNLIYFLWVWIIKYRRIPKEQLRNGNEELERVKFMHVWWICGSSEGQGTDSAQSGSLEPHVQLFS